MKCSCGLRLPRSVVAIRWPHGDRLPTAFFAAGTGFLIAAVVQFKGWGYQLYPARAFLILFLTAAAGTLLKEVPSLTSLLRGGRRGLAFVFAGVLVAASARYVAEARRPAAPDLVAPMTQAFATHAPGPGGDLEHADDHLPGISSGELLTRLVGTAPQLPLVPAWLLHRSGSVGRRAARTARSSTSMTELERQFFDDIVDDLCASPPTLLAIEQAMPAAPAGRRSLDLRSYYGQSPKARHLLDAYQRPGNARSFHAS